MADKTLTSVRIDFHTRDQEKSRDVDCGVSLGITDTLSAHFVGIASAQHLGATNTFETDSIWSFDLPIAPSIPALSRFTQLQIRIVTIGGFNTWSFDFTVVMTFEDPDGVAGSITFTSSSSAITIRGTDAQLGEYVGAVPGFDKFKNENA